MMTNIDKTQNLNRIAIISVGYNRLKSQKRLLESLLRADYSNYDSIPLVISIDCSGDEELYEYVRHFEWPFGEKYVLIREKRMGLKEHILSCGDLTEFFKGIILLEDDIYVSKDFYNYTVQMENAYGDCPDVVSIALYSNETNGFCSLPFSALINESDVFASQSVATWGEYWNRRMWQSFRIWYDNTEIKWKELDMPHQIKEWTRAWSKYYDAFMVENNKYSIYPYISLTTNFSDAGEHGDANNTIVQVSLQQGYKNYLALPFEELVKYDSYTNNIALADVIGIPLNNICLDLYGVRPNEFKKRYYLSVKKLPYKVVKSYGLYMRPMELNVIENISGGDIFLYDTSVKTRKPTTGGKVNYLLYHLKGFNFLYMPYVNWGYTKFIVSRLLSKLKKKIIK